MTEAELVDSFLHAEGNGLCARSDACPSCRRERINAEYDEYLERFGYADAARLEQEK